jgi:hypothetical protein
MKEKKNGVCIQNVNMKRWTNSKETKKNKGIH